MSVALNFDIFHNLPTENIIDNWANTLNTINLNLQNENKNNFKNNHGISFEDAEKELQKLYQVITGYRKILEIKNVIKNKQTAAECSTEECLNSLKNIVYANYTLQSQVAPNKQRTRSPSAQNVVDIPSVNNDEANQVAEQAISEMKIDLANFQDNYEALKAFQNTLINQSDYQKNIGKLIENYYSLKVLAEEYIQNNYQDQNLEQYDSVLEDLSKFRESLTEDKKTTFDSHLKPFEELLNECKSLLKLHTQSTETGVAKSENKIDVVPQETIVDTQFNLNGFNATNLTNLFIKADEFVSNVKNKNLSDINKITNFVGGIAGLENPIINIEVIRELFTKYRNLINKIVTTPTIQKILSLDVATCLDLFKDANAVCVYKREKTDSKSVRCSNEDKILFLQTLVKALYVNIDSILNQKTDGSNTDFTKYLKTKYLEMDDSTVSNIDIINKNTENLKKISKYTIDYYGLTEPVSNPTRHVLKHIYIQDYLEALQRFLNEYDKLGPAETYTQNILEHIADFMNKHRQNVILLVKLVFYFENESNVNAFQESVKTRIDNILQNNVISYIKLRNVDNSQNIDDLKYSLYNKRFEILLNYLENTPDNFTKMILKYNDDDLSYYDVNANGKYSYNNDVFHELDVSENSKNSSTFDLKFNKYNHTYMFGPFNRVFLPNHTNEEITERVNELHAAIKNKKIAFIIGYGASGAGKTSNLIYLNKGEKDKRDGVLIHLCNRYGNENYTKLTVKIRELYWDRVAENINVDKSDFNSELTKYEFTFTNNSFTLDSEIKHTDKHSYRAITKARMENKDAEASKTFEAKTSLGEVLIYLIDTDRFVKATTNNPNSSRSHSLVYIELKQDTSPENVNEGNTIKLIVGDFAGVENKFNCEDPGTLNKFLIAKRDVPAKNISYYSTEAIDGDPDPVMGGGGDDCEEYLKRQGEAYDFSNIVFRKIQNNLYIKDIENANIINPNDFLDTNFNKDIFTKVFNYMCYPKKQIKNIEKYSIHYFKNNDFANIDENASIKINKIKEFLNRDFLNKIKEQILNNYNVETAKKEVEDAENASQIRSKRAMDFLIESITNFILYCQAFYDKVMKTEITITSEEIATKINSTLAKKIQDEEFLNVFLPINYNYEKISQTKTLKSLINNGYFFNVKSNQNKYKILDKNLSNLNPDNQLLMIQNIITRKFNDLINQEDIKNISNLVLTSIENIDNVYSFLNKISNLKNIKNDLLNLIKTKFVEENQQKQQNQDQDHKLVIILLCSLLAKLYFNEHVKQTNNIYTLKDIVKGNNNTKYIEKDILNPQNIQLKEILENKLNINNLLGGGPNRDKHLFINTLFDKYMYINIQSLSKNYIDHLGLNKEVVSIKNLRNELKDIESLNKQASKYLDNDTPIANTNVTNYIDVVWKENDDITNFFKICFDLKKEENIYYQINEILRLKEDEIKFAYVSAYLLKDILLEQKCRLDNIKQICNNRVGEGSFINNSLREMRQYIQYLILDRNKNALKFSPNYVSECLNIYCPTRTSCFELKKERTQKDKNVAPKSTIFEMIKRDFFNDNDKEMNNKLLICIFCVVNLEKSANNPPPIPYVDINELKYQFKKDIKAKVEEGVYQIILCLNKVIENITKYGDKLSDLTMTQEYTEIVGLIMTNTLNNVLENEDQDSQLINFKNLVNEFINAVDNSNAASTLGTIEFVDQISKLNTVNTICKNDITTEVNIDETSYTELSKIVIKELTQKTS